MRKAKTHYTDEFKREAVRVCKEPGVLVTQVARNLGVEQSVLRRWVKLEATGSMEMDASKPLRPEAISEVQRLQRELRRVTMERDILKNALVYFAKEPQ
jgi:transposase